MSELGFCGNFINILSKAFSLDPGISISSQNSISGRIKEPTPPLMPFSLERWIKQYPGILTVEAKLSFSQVSVNAKTDMFICDNKRLISGSLLFRLRQFRWANENSLQYLRLFEKSCNCSRSL